jgi:glycosyltransferase involved in cell wall biosynthesis
MTADRTALVVHPSPDLYGSDRVLLETLSALVEAGYRTVLALPELGPLVDAATARGAEVQVCPTPIVRKSALRPRGAVRFLATTLGSVRPARHMLRDLKPDLVFVNTVTIPLWILLGRLAGVRTICHVHEAEASQPAFLRKLLYSPLLLADRILVNSKFSLGVLADSWPRIRARSAVIYNGVPGPATAPVPLRASPLDGPRLLFIGRLSPRKGPQVVVAALAGLRQRGVQARLGLLGSVFPGYEWFQAELHERVRKLGLDAQVEFIGFDPDIWAHLAAADIICVPSTVDEPFGNTAVEAMLAGRPLIVSDTSGLKEAAGGFKSARFVTPDDPAAIVEAVEDLLAHWSELPALVAADRLRAVATYDPAVYRNAITAALAA